MNKIFENTYLEQPKNHEFLWRFIKKKYVKNFLKGELHFACLKDFDDYYEAITPLHYFMLIFKRRSYNLRISNKSNHLKTLNDRINESRIFLEITQLQKQLMEITHINDKDKIAEVFTESIENLEKFHLKHIENQKRYYSG